MSFYTQFDTELWPEVYTNPAFDCRTADEQQARVNTPARECQLSSRGGVFRHGHAREKSALPWRSERRERVDKRRLDHQHDTSVHQASDNCPAGIDYALTDKNFEVGQNLTELQNAERTLDLEYGRLSRYVHQVPRTTVLWLFAQVTKLSLGRFRSMSSIRPKASLSRCIQKLQWQGRCGRIH